MQDASPFPFYGPLDPEQLTGREALVHDLSERLLAHRVTALLGPRRYGKTSVLRQVAADLAGVGPETLWVDLYELTSMADLAGRLDDGLAAVQGRLGRTVRAIAASLHDQGRGGQRRPLARQPQASRCRVGGAGAARTSSCARPNSTSCCSCSTSSPASPASPERPA